MVTAGEILHHHLAAGRGVYASLGKNCCCLDEDGGASLFEGLDFAVTADPAKADFLYVGRLPAGRAVDDYLDVLNHAASLACRF